MGRLYLVGTPIGNLGDLSPRAEQTLREADFIAAEDTRVTRKLLSRFSIQRPMVSYHEHNAREQGELILRRLEAGETGALVTDAGMPCISDPGEQLVQLCAGAGIPVEVIPGPSALISALALSGISSRRFCFEGFLDAKSSQRRRQLQALREERRTLVFYEAPHKLLATLQEMSEAFGPERPVALCRELTKLYEQTVRTTLGEAVERYQREEPRGEFVLVVEGAREQPSQTVGLAEAVERMKVLMAEGMPATAAAKQAALETGYKKGELYQAAMREEPSI